MVDLREIAESYGTPTYVYDLAKVREAARALSGDLPDGVGVYYSLKANPHPALVTALDGEGCRAEITSVGELASVVEAGIDPGGCLYTGPGKSADSIRRALEEGVRFFSVESETDLRRVSDSAEAQGHEVDCLLRVNGSQAAGGSGLRMSGASSQFGTDFDGILSLSRLGGVCPAVRVRGLHFFSVSNAADEKSLIGEFTQAVTSAAELAELGVPVEILDIGGGFAAPFAGPGAAQRYGVLADALSEILDKCFSGWRDGTPRVVVESGRGLVAESGTLLLRVLDMKVSRGQRFAVLDGGVNSLGGLSGLGRLLPMSVRPNGMGPDADPTRLVGPLCTPLDELGRDVRIPDLAVGDVLEIPNVGAYGMTASLVAFLGHPAAAEVIVDGDRVVAATRLELKRTMRPRTVTEVVR